jgi:hypothetical protein
MNPFYTIWFKPRATFQYLSALNINDSKIGLLLLAISLSISPTAILNLSKKLEVSGVFGYFFCTLFGVLMSYLLIRHVLSFIYWGFSKILNGNATLNQTRIVVAYSMTPYLIYLLFTFFLLTSAITSGDFEILYFQQPITRYFITIMFLRNIVYGLSAINKFSYGFALLNAMIPVLIIEVLIFATR